jgi:hypothetical protein
MWYSLALVVPVAAAQTAADTIPMIHGTVLTGSKVDLPQGLSGKEGVLVVGFSQSSRVEVTAWGKRLAAEYKDSPTVVYYEMPVLAGVPKLLRGWVLKKVTEGVPDRAKARCLPVFDHEADWKAASGFTRDEDAYVLLVDGTGKVIWRTEGPVDDQHFAELKRRLLH